jgi:hypothetical protein
MIRLIRFACTCTAGGPSITNAATRRCLSAMRRHRAAPPSASSIHILRARKHPWDHVTGGIARSTRCLASSGSSKVCCWKKSGKHLLASSFSGFDPTETSGLGPLGQSSTRRWCGDGRPHTRAAIAASNATSASSPAAVVKNQIRSLAIPYAARRSGRKKLDQLGWRLQPHLGLFLRIDSDRHACGPKRLHAALARRDLVRHVHRGEANGLE